MRHLVARAVETLEHFIKIDISQEMATKLVECYTEQNEEELANLLQPIIEEHGNKKSELKVDFVGFE
jgi:lipopolysaccharide biosynthesis regulator YciM